MSQIRIEPEGQIREAACTECAGTNRLLHGYVYEEDEARGLYFVEWCDGDHPVRRAFISLGLGDFSAEEGGERFAFCIEWRDEAMRLSEEPARDRPDLVGTFVPRDAALPMVDGTDFWHIADHIVTDDPRLFAVQEWLAGR
jgi:hypothetical protein